MIFRNSDRLSVDISAINYRLEELKKNSVTYLNESNETVDSPVPCTAHVVFFRFRVYLAKQFRGKEKKQKSS